MGVRFRKSFKIAPGMKLNFGKKGVSATVGGNGAHYTINSSGKKNRLSAVTPRRQLNTSEDVPLKNEQIYCNIFGQPLQLGTSVLERLLFLYSKFHKLHRKVIQCITKRYYAALSIYAFLQQNK